MQKLIHLPTQLEGIQWDGTDKQLQDNKIPYWNDGTGNYYLRRANVGDFYADNSLITKGDWVVKDDRFDQWIVVYDADRVLEYSVADKYYHLYEAYHNLDRFCDDYFNHESDYRMKEISGMICKLDEVMCQIEDDFGFGRK